MSVCGEGCGRWSRGPGQNRKVTDGLCSLSARLGQSITGCPHIATQMTQTVQRQESEQQKHDTAGQNQEEEPLPPAAGLLCPLLAKLDIAL